MIKVDMEGIVENSISDNKDIDQDGTEFDPIAPTLPLLALIDPNFPQLPSISFN